MVTFAFGTSAPVGSETVPSSSPLTAWPSIALRKTTVSANKAHSNVSFMDWASPHNNAAKDIQCLCISPPNDSITARRLNASYRKTTRTGRLSTPIGSGTHECGLSQRSHYHEGLGMCESGKDLFVPSPKLVRLLRTARLMARRRGFHHDRGLETRESGMDLSVPSLLLARGWICPSPAQN